MPNKRLIVLIVLWMVAIISLIHGIVTPSKIKRQILQEAKTVRQEERILSSRKIIPVRRQAKRTDFAAWGRSPFLPKEMAIRRFPGLTLNGIVWDRENPKAIINDNIVGIGDRVGENIIIDIKHDRVVLNDGINDFELRLE